MSAPFIHSATAQAVLGHAISDTLRIPLAARAYGDEMHPSVAVHDAHARNTLEKLGGDGRVWLKQRSGVYGVLSRTCIFRRLAQAFLQRQPEGQVVNLGSGLTDYFQWLDNGRAQMLDADLPDVMQLRRELLGPVAGRHRLADLDLTAPGWWERLGLPATRDGAPVFLMSEGVFMYLAPAVVHAVLAEFGERAPAGSVLAFDAMTWLAVGRGRQHPAIRHTRAQIAWGPRRLRELTDAHPRIAITAVHKVMEGFGPRFSLFWPLLQRLFGVPMYALYELRAVDRRD